MARSLNSSHSLRPRIVATALSFSSLALNWVWVNLPLYQLGISGRSAVIYGRITLLQTFLYPHPYLILWTLGFSTNLIFSVLSITGWRWKVAHPIFTSIASGASTLTLWLLIMDRWNYSTKLLPMYFLGLPSAMIPILLGSSLLAMFIWRGREKSAGPGG
jgi:hypothetical protein